MKRKNLDAVMERANEVLNPVGFECIEAEWNQHDELLRLYVDRPEGVDMQACVEVTKILRPIYLIEKRDPDSYQFEVSSPGVERPLRRRAHFLPYIGKEIAVSLDSELCPVRLAGVSAIAGAAVSAGVGERRKGVGVLLAVETVESEDVITLMTETGEWRFGLSQVRKANVVYKWVF